MGEFTAAEHGAIRMEGTFCTGSVSELHTEPADLGSNAALPHSVT